MTVPVLLDLAPHLNALAATFDGERHLGVVNAWGNSFPAEELPFGGTTTVRGLPFRLPEKRPGCCDHVEALGQEIALPPTGRVHGLALLCFGEMGPQRLDLELQDGRRRVRAEVTAPGWLAEAGVADDPSGLRCTHLHYPGGYELDHLRPCLWAVPWLAAVPAGTAVFRLGMNPLFHLMAVTLLTEDGHD